MSKPIEYLCQIDSGNVPGTDTTWSITSPDTTEWGMTVSTAGIITITSGVTVIGDPVVLAMNGSASTFSIADTGIVSIVSSSTLLTGSDSVAALADSNSVTWMFVHGLDGVLSLTSETPLENKFYYPAIVISFEVADNLDQFELHAIKPNTSMHRR